MVGQDGWINGWDGCDGLMDECVDEQIALMDEQVN